MLEANFWQDKNNSQKVIKEKKFYDDLVNSFKNSAEKLRDLEELTELALEEERRLFFVGLTRAEEQLHISWARNRALGSKRSRKPSMYIRELSDLLDPTPLKFGGDRKALSQKIRAFLSSQSVTDHQPKVIYSEQSCMDELDSIRRNITKANDSKPEIVLSDDAIAALVSLKPKSIKDLRKISQVSSAIIDRFGDQIIEIFS